MPGTVFLTLKPDDRNFWRTLRPPAHSSEQRHRSAWLPLLSTSLELYSSLSDFFFTNTFLNLIVPFW